MKANRVPESLFYSRAPLPETPSLDLMRQNAPKLNIELVKGRVDDGRHKTFIIVKTPRFGGCL